MKARVQWIICLCILLQSCFLDDSKPLWSEEFNGVALDKAFWQHHNQGVRFGAVNSIQAVELNTETLKINTTAQANGEIHTGMISTKGKFEINSGFLEIRFRSGELPPGMQCSVWFQSPLFGKKEIDLALSPAKTGSVVTLIQLNEKNLQKTASSITTGSFGAAGKRVSQYSPPNIAPNKFHVIGVHMEQDQYSFYLNGEQYWQADEGMSGVPMYLVASCEVKDSIGQFDVSQQHVIEFDYIRHYSKFQEYDPSNESTAIEQSDWSKLDKNNVSTGSFEQQDTRFKPAQASSESALRVVLREGSHLGVDSKYEFPQKEQPEEIWMSYCMRFSDDWQAEVGGKLPGFAGDSSAANGGQGGNPSDGTNAWSARMLYGGLNTENNSIPVGSYIYHADQRGDKFGDTDWWIPGEDKQFKHAIQLEKNRWYTVTQHIVMNSSSSADGRLEAFIDGEKVYDRTKLKFTENEKYRTINYFWLDVYHGGKEKSALDQAVYFDQFNYNTGIMNKTYTACAN